MTTNYITPENAPRDVESLARLPVAALHHLMLMTGGFQGAIKKTSARRAEKVFLALGDDWRVRMVAAALTRYDLQKELQSKRDVALGSRGTM